MPLSSPLTSLRALVAVDAITCAAMGVCLVAAAGPVGAATAIPPALLSSAGLVLIPIAMFMAVVATPPVTQRTAAGLVIAGNGLWVAASLLLLLGGWIDPNALGLTFIAGQALAVAALAKLEFDAWRISDLQASAG